MLTRPASEAAFARPPYTRASLRSGGLVFESDFWMVTTIVIVAIIVTTVIISMFSITTSIITTKLTILIIMTTMIKYCCFISHDGL